MTGNLKIEGKFIIQVKMIQGVVFTFNNVKDYWVEPGDFVSFKDSKTGETKKYHASNCEIKLDKRSKDVQSQ